MAYPRAATSSLLGLWILLTPVSFADGPSWSRTFGTETVDGLNHVEPLPDGGFIVAGTTGERGLAARFDAAGNPLWLRTYDCGPLDEIRPAPGGGFVAVGLSGGLVFVLKLDDNGSPEWQHTHGNGVGWRNRTVQPAADGGYFVGAQHPGDRPSIVKLGSDGTFEWRRELHYSYYHGLVATPQGGVKLLNFRSSDQMIDELDAAGELIHEFAVRSTDIQALTTFFEGESIETADGGLACSGEVEILTPDGTTSYWNAAIVKIGEDYSGEWFAAVGAESAAPRARSLCEKTDGGYVVVLTTNSGGQYGHCRVVRLDAQGHLQWQWHFTEGSCSGIRETHDGGLVLVGRRPVSGARDDAWVAKLGPSGTLPDSCDFWTPETWECTLGGVTLPTELHLIHEPLSNEAPASVTAEELEFSWAEQCSGPPVLGPDDEISRPGSSTPLIFSDPTTLEWEDPAGGGVDSFNLYLGSVTDLPGSYGSCLEPEIPVPAFTHMAEPPPGSTWFYLVTGNTHFGETTLGRDGHGGLRPNTGPCI